ncbi:uncharacterized protein LOC117779967 [Drosophila innubila]|uniref:uncharacterized protein LOC117779967 n=1 Tax=Drosophila innubila TaxID=198719 RepID=UPI00148E57EA|nr:uncharacterized protein LOC117779967 [Drosophila innubila]
MSDLNDLDLATSAIVIKKTYTLTCIFILTAVFQWYFVVAYIRVDLSGYSTSFMMMGFLFVTIFHSVPSLRHVYPYNYVFMLITAELLILGAGTLSMKSSLRLLISLTLSTLFVFMCLIIMGAILQKSIEVNPFCAVTTFFFSFMSISMMIYFHITLETPMVLMVSNFIVVYAILGVVIFHSMVVHNGQSRLYHDDYFLMGLLLFVDFICIFVVGMIYVIGNFKKPQYLCGGHEVTTPAKVESAIFNENFKHKTHTAKP